MPPNDTIADQANHDLQQNRPAAAAGDRLRAEAHAFAVPSARARMDITALFKAAAGQLLPGQLIKDEYFTLFEAVGALEIMDPKMDSGAIPPGDSFEPEFDVCRGLDADELLWILDELLMMETAWHDGFPLSQTVFTSLHIDRLLSPATRAPYTFLYGDEPDRPLALGAQLTHVVLRAYCVALVKCCQASLQLIQSQSFYEEEDFVTHLFGRDLLPRIAAGEAHSLLADALSVTAAMADIPSTVRDAIQHRLEFRSSYLAALEGSVGSWSTMAKHLEAVNHTHHLARLVPEAFSETVQRKLATSTPPRPMLKLSWSVACQACRKLCDDIVEANRLVNHWVCQSPHSLQRATWAFAYREPPPRTFARAYFQHLLFGDERLTDNMTHFDLFLADIRNLVLAGDPLADVNSFQVELPTSPQYLCSRQMEVFLEKGFDEFLNLYRMVCQNRCRIRRTFTQAVGILDGLQSEARRIDDMISSIAPPTVLQNTKGLVETLRPLESWAKYHRLRIMILTIQLGFETEIYLPHEMSMMHWFLSHLGQALYDVLSHTETFLLERMRRVTKQRQTQYAAECLSSHDWIKSLKGRYGATIAMSRALFRMHTVICPGNAMPSAQPTNGSAELFFEARMKASLGLSNDPDVRLEDFRRAQQGLLIASTAATCDDIQTDLKTAKAALSGIKDMAPHEAQYVGTEDEWKREMKQLETTCVAIAVQCAKLARAPEQPDAGQTRARSVDVALPAPEKRYHIWWIVPEIKGYQS